MRPAAFEYVAPTSVAAAVESLERGGYDAKVIAGGQSLVPMLNFRLARPELLVDVGRIPELRGISVESDRVSIGAMTTHREIEESDALAGVLPVMRVAAREIGHSAIRNRGTIGGSLAHADASAEWPIVATALDARMRVSGPGGERTIPAREFFVGHFTTALSHDELLTAVEIPVPADGAGWSFHELARQPGAFALVIVVVAARLGSDGAVASLSIALGGVGSTPVVPDAAGLLGSVPSAALVRQAADEIARDIDPPSDVHAGTEDRRDIARALVARGLSDALAMAGAQDLDSGVGG
jgi:carbon-monoxide dehydrogenase medium subunit